jgi:hypothetical protein
VLKVAFLVFCQNVRKTYLYFSTNQAVCYPGNMIIKTGYMLLNNVSLTGIKLYNYDKVLFVKVIFRKSRKKTTLVLSLV